MTTNESLKKADELLCEAFKKCIKAMKELKEAMERLQMSQIGQKSRGVNPVIYRDITK